MHKKLFLIMLLILIVNNTQQYLIANQSFKMAEDPLWPHSIVEIASGNEIDLLIL